MQPLNNMVTKERKQALLLEAMRDRRTWIYSSSPFHSIEIADENPTTRTSLFPTLSRFASSKVSTYLPDASKVLEVLYGVDDKYNIDSDDAGAQILQSDMERYMLNQWKQVTQDTSLDTIQYTPSSNIIDEEISNNYHLLLIKLESPEYCAIVQEIRQFVDGLDQMITKIQKDTLQKMMTTESFLESSYHVSIQDLPKVTLTLQKFLQYIQDRFSRQFDWDTSDPWHSMKDAMMESFIYSKCFQSISPLVPCDILQQDVALKEKMQCLYSFLKPEHLDLHYFKSFESTIQPAWDCILSEPIHLVHVLDHLVAPSMILSYILKTFKSICKALDSIITHGAASASLEDAFSMDDMSSSPSILLPGADEIFPTLIWTLICAQPNHLVSALFHVNAFTCSDEIRGELNYAYTSFVSAVQFVRDLNLETDDSSLAVCGLSISKEELQKGLHVFKTNHSRIMSPIQPTAMVDSTTVDPFEKQKPVISVNAVREARMRGENLNLDWALQNLECLDSTENSRQEPSSDPVEKSASIANTFPRIYPYLHVDTKDIRMSDVPLLLKEYHSLVQVVECLYSERSHDIQAKRRKDIQSKRDELKKEAMEANEMMSSSLK